MSDTATIDAASNQIETIISRVRNAVITDKEFLETVLSGLLARGHVLLEDVPGTGKTLTAVALADALNLAFNRIQFTPDLLPSDITGSQIYNEQAGEFRFQRGPVFANVVLADEINRAPPKTQSALLEAMDEGQVTVGGTTYELPDPFFVIATQNPIEQEGTFRLPEAQRDRFVVKTSLGYPDRDGEIELLSRREDRTTKLPAVDPVVDAGQVSTLRQLPEQVRMETELKGYLVDLVRESRDDARVDVGVSPRGVQRFFEAARARAVIRGRDYVTPDDIKTIARPVMTHRLVLTSEAAIQDVDAATIVESVLEGVPVPGATGEA
ncbi:AAA family ATPase [Halonotius pteroides]|uniref:ATPase n=1 Tax=Halonotius pteroides TaxID=268735 RepID=A0A3A6QB92_9EURY|nr:MoxR family ATPase [Halonotius pteroides]RJX49710.1 ATPase [Halonotius pteroides]